MSKPTNLPTSKGYDFLSSDTSPYYGTLYQQSDYRFHGVEPPILGVIILGKVALFSEPCTKHTWVVKKTCKCFRCRKEVNHD